MSVRPDGWAVADRAPAWTSGQSVGHARDGYGRLLAVCYAGGENINDRLVREGWALDSADYSEAEADSKRWGAGLWRGEFVPPWRWRSERRLDWPRSTVQHLAHSVV